MAPQGGKHVQATRSERVRTLIVDDEEDMRVLIAEVIQLANGGLEVVGEAKEGESALEARRRLRPDVVILDHRMPGMSGVEVATRMLAEDPGQAIVLFSAYLDAGLEAEALGAGVCSVLSKDRYRDLPDALWRCAG